MHERSEGPEPIDGMLHLDHAGRVQLFEEKPEIASPVSMGIYVVEPSALAHLLADLVKALLAAGEPVGAFRHQGLWFDIGRPTDYRSEEHTSELQSHA